MQIEAAKAGDVTIVRFSGDADRVTLRPVRGQLETLLDESGDRVVFDLSGAGFFDSAAIVTLLRARQRVQARGGDVILAHCSNVLRKSFTTLGLDKLFAFATDVDDAVSYFAT